MFTDISNLINQIIEDAETFSSEISQVIKDIETFKDEFENLKNELATFKSAMYVLSGVIVATLIAVIVLLILVIMMKKKNDEMASELKELNRLISSPDFLKKSHKETNDSDIKKSENAENIKTAHKTKKSDK